MGDTYADSYWLYKPTQGIASAFAIPFFVHACLFIWQNTKNRSWHLDWPLPIATLFLAAAFSLREAGAHFPHNLGLYISSTVLVYVAPPFYALSNYTNFIVLAIRTPEHSLIPPRYLHPIFIFGFIGIEALTANGVSYIANRTGSAANTKVGTELLKTSLLIQLLLSLFFFANILIFHRRCSRARALAANTRAILLVLSTSTGLILIRTIFRIAQIFSSRHSALNTQEACFYVLEAAPMLAITFILNVWPPGRLLVGNPAICCRSVDAGSELEGVMDSPDGSVKQGID